MTNEDLLKRTAAVLRAVIAKEAYKKYTPEDGCIDDGYRTVGQRTVQLYEEINSFVEQREKAEKALTELVKMSEELGLYNTSFPILPPDTPITPAQIYNWPFGTAA